MGESKGSYADLNQYMLQAAQDEMLLFLHIASCPKSFCSQWYQNEDYYADTEKFQPTQNASRMINSLKAEIYFTNEILKPEYLKLNPIARRYYAEHAWLQIHGSELDRVLHSDAADVFFVGSPLNLFKYDTLNFVSEGSPINSNDCNIRWMRSLVGKAKYET